MNTNRRRLARLVSEIEAAGGRLVCDGVNVRVVGIEWECLPTWIERNKPDLVALLRHRDRRRTQNPA